MASGLDRKQQGEMNGGERGIRTLGAAINGTHDFQSCTFSQLGHLSVSEARNQERSAMWSRKEDSLAERVGFEPTIPVLARIPLFESGAFSHSATSPFPGPFLENLDL